jgi:hypothetical protein
MVDEFSITLVNLLKDGGVLPESLDVSDPVVQSEGLTYMMLFRASVIAMDFAANSYMCGAKEMPEDLVPGWKVQKYISFYEQGE